MYVGVGHQSYSGELYEGESFDTYRLQVRVVESLQTLSGVRAGIVRPSMPDNVRRPAERTQTSS